jgi:hypothetical protein
MGRASVRVVRILGRRCRLGGTHEVRSLAELRMRGRGRLRGRWRGRCISLPWSMAGTFCLGAAAAAAAADVAPHALARRDVGGQRVLAQHVVGVLTLALPRRHAIFCNAAGQRRAREQKKARRAQGRDGRMFKTGIRLCHCLSLPPPRWWERCDCYFDLRANNFLSYLTI